jgi:hypothetical protein
MEISNELGFQEAMGSLAGALRQRGTTTRDAWAQVPFVVAVSDFIKGFVIHQGEQEEDRLDVVASQYKRLGAWRSWPKMKMNCRTGALGYDGSWSDAELLTHAFSEGVAGLEHFDGQLALEEVVMLRERGTPKGWDVEPTNTHWVKVVGQRGVTPVAGWEGRSDALGHFGEAFAALAPNWSGTMRELLETTLEVSETDGSEEVRGLKAWSLDLG